MKKTTGITINRWLVLLDHYIYLDTPSRETTKMKLRQLENILFVVLMVFLLSFAGARELYVGTDTPAYYRIFEMIASSGSWFKVHYYEPLYVFINHLLVSLGARLST